MKYDAKGFRALAERQRGSGAPKSRACAEALSSAVAEAERLRAENARIRDTAYGFVYGALSRDDAKQLWKKLEERTP